VTSSRRKRTSLVPSVTRQLGFGTFFGLIAHGKDAAGRVGAEASGATALRSPRPATVLFTCPSTSAGSGRRALINVAGERTAPGDDTRRHP
jgi:hypothetical protein